MGRPVEAVNSDSLNMDLEEYYKNPIIESWTYVSIGMDNLKSNDPDSYNKINKRQAALFPETEERFRDISLTCKELNLDYLEVKSYIREFLQKFPLALKKQVGWDDVNFIFLYVLTKMFKPRVIIETGSNVGFSSTFIALAVKENNNGCKFYTIDPYLEYPWEKISFVEHCKIRDPRINYKKLNGKCKPLSMVPADLKEHIIFKGGCSEDILPNLVEENREVDIFFHDSDHSYRNMAWECSTVMPYLKKDGFILVHDIMQNSAFKDMFDKNGTFGFSVLNRRRSDLGVFRKTNKNFPLKGQWVSSFDNSRLNDNEYQSKEIKLMSSPKDIVIHLTGHCGLNCIFCPEEKNDKRSNFDYFRQQLEGKISRYISQAEKIIFKTCGMPFQSPEFRKMINWGCNSFEVSFPEVEKIYFTNGLDLTPEVCDFIVHPRGVLFFRYITKTTVNIFLYASNSQLYKTLTGCEDFYKILGQIRYLIYLRSIANNPKAHLAINIIFIATTLNIEDLPDFVRLASNLGIDKVICFYPYIYNPTQSYLSCFFKQEMTNKMLQMAEELAKKLNVKIELPPKFAQKEYPKLGLCRRAWSQITINTTGDVLACGSSEECNESLGEKGLMEIWNGPYYQEVRKSLIEGNCPCFKYCIRANPQAVNDVNSHMIKHKGDISRIDIL